MRKFAAIFFAGILVFGSGVAMQTFRPYNSGNLAQANIDLAQVMTNTGAILLESTVDAWCEVQLVVHKAEDAGNILAKALSGMGLPGAGPIQLETVEGAEEFGQMTMHEARVELELPNGMKLLGTVQSTASDGRQDTYLMLNLFDESAEPDLVAMYDLIVKGTAAVGSTPEHATQLVGVIAGQLTPNRVAELVSQIMSDTKAEVKHLYQNGPLVSATGYSPSLDTADAGTPGLVNINLAMRYSAETNNTWIYLGSPTVWEPI